MNTEYSINLIHYIYGSKENVILLGYCEIQYIQNYLTKVRHTERVEGWAANVFELPAPYNNIAICTGYAPFGTKNKNGAKCANGGKNCIIITILVNAKE